jgi:hypothetical protein
MKGMVNNKERIMVIELMMAKIMTMKLIWRRMERV